LLKGALPLVWGRNRTIAFVGHRNRLLRRRPPGTTSAQRTVPALHETKPLPRWSNQPLRLYHGTLESTARSIVSRGVSLAHGGLAADFGPGFYTTSHLEFAAGWAWTRQQQHPGSRAGVVAADLDRDSLASLSWLAFARGDPGAHDYWSFVTHCRARRGHHARSAPAGPLYDAVIGPVAVILKDRFCMPEADQISFHTPAAEAVLNAARWRFV
jgi:hypothetical protein